VADSYLGVRVDILRRSQNPDGGWSYYKGKQSWLEPTFYGALVLHGEPAADRAWSLIKAWQQPDGSWPPTAGTAISSSVTALCLILANIRGEVDGAYLKGLAYLLKTAGTESELWRRSLARFGLVDPGRNLSLKGWPWNLGTSSWVEPTAHTLIALKKTFALLPAPELTERIQSGEALLLDVRCKDGGWNYGSAWALGEDQRSYPETLAANDCLHAGARLDNNRIKAARRCGSGCFKSSGWAWFTGSDDRGSRSPGRRRRKLWLS
jgi:hypothetical protein